MADRDGPHGWQYAAVNTGHLTIRTDGYLYLTESFAFRVLERGAAVYLKPKRGKK